MITLEIKTPNRAFNRSEKPDYRAKRTVVANATNERVVWAVVVRNAEEMVRFIRENDTEARLQFGDEVDEEGREIVTVVFPNKTTPTLPPAPPGPPEQPRS